MRWERFLADGSYLLALNIPAYRDGAGTYHVDALWHKDLELHREYLDAIELACPVRRVDAAPAGTRPLTTVVAGRGIRMVELPYPTGWGCALLQLPACLMRLAAAVRRARIVHTCVAGWPYPLGWLAIPLMRRAGGGRLGMVVVESAPWRLAPGKPAGWRARWRARLFEAMARYCVRHAAIRVFTHAQYRDSLMPASAADALGYVVNASWIDDERVLDEAAARASWADKLSPQPALKCLFVGRLVEEKGVPTMLEAFAMLGPMEDISLDILGDGPLLEVCRSRYGQRDAIRFLGSMPYDDAYFALLRNYHVLIVPGISDEQPRVIYDAYAQVLAVVASDTPGNRACVEEGVSGTLFTAGSAAVLAACLRACRSDLERCAAMAMKGLERARRHTHRQMHAERQRILAIELEKHAGGDVGDD